MAFQIAGRTPSSACYHFLSRDPRPDQVRVALPGSAGDVHIITHATAAAPPTRKWAGRDSACVSEALEVLPAGSWPVLVESLS